MRTKQSSPCSSTHLTSVKSLFFSKGRGHKRPCAWVWKLPGHLSPVTVRFLLWGFDMTFPAGGGEEEHSSKVPSSPSPGPMLSFTGTLTHGASGGRSSGDTVTLGRFRVTIAEEAFRGRIQHLHSRQLLPPPVSLSAAFQQKGKALASMGSSGPVSWDTCKYPVATPFPTLL